SVGSAVALVGVVVALLTINHDVNPILAVIIALGAGVAMGAWQGLWVTRMGVSSFIVTLAGMLYFRGASMIATNGSTLAPLPDSLADLATGFLPPAPAIALIVVGIGAFAGFQLLGARRAQQLGLLDGIGPHLMRRMAPFIVGGVAFAWVASRQGIPYLVLLVAITAVGAEIVMRRTRFGLQLYAIGGNPEAARLSGIRVNRVIFYNFLIAGLAYGVTGVALTARVGGAVAGSAGLFLELDAISAAIIGGTSLTGGRGRVFGALVGALLMGSLNNGMSLMNVPTFYQETARGVVLLFAVAADQYRRTRKVSRKAG
ncbi:MAG: D-xylose transport system permease protein, partial [Myxococcales bacterium]|nr:D-xylose transport system permease protein [Myxococcales bacterium]